MSELIENRPLVYGFIEDGNLHSLIKWPFMEEVSVFQPVGKSLVDFIRFDRYFMTSVFEILLVRYGEVFLKGQNRPFFLRKLVSLRPKLSSSASCRSMESKVRSSRPSTEE